jgi:hypothetical protein
MDALATAARAVTKKPIIYSMADGYHGSQGWFYLDADLYDCIDQHGYFEPYRNYIGRSLDKVRIVGELGPSSGASTETQKIGETREGFVLGKNNSCAVYFWERSGRYYSSGSVVTASAGASSAYANLI